MQPLPPDAFMNWIFFIIIIILDMVRIADRRHRFDRFTEYSAMKK